MEVKKVRPGRPVTVERARYVTLYLSAADAAKLRKLGGSRWVRQKLAEA